jgi:hypothetical protein
VGRSLGKIREPGAEVSLLRYTPAPDFGKGFCGGFGLGAGRETPMLSST